MKSKYSILLCYIATILFYSCQNNTALTVTVDTKKGLEYNNWIIDKSYHIDGIDGTGICALNEFIFLSDTSQNIVISYDTLQNSLDTIAHELKVCYMNQKKSKVIMPVYDRDSVFVYRGDPNYYKFSLPITLNNPTSFDGLSIHDFALVDQSNDRFIINNKKEYITIGEKGDEDGQFDTPTSVCLHSNKYYVIDSGNKRIQIFDKLGNFISSFGENDDLLSPTGITSDRINLYISDTDKNQILIYNGNGELQDSIEQLVYYPSDVYSYKDKLYVSNKKEQTITVLKRK